MHLQLRNLRVLITLLFIAALPISSYSQLIITTPDTTICPNTSVTLNAMINATPSNSLPAADDQYSPVVPLGFGFNFFGNIYTTCIVSTNGYIKFNTAQAGGFSAWAIGQAIPGNNNVLNSIMGFYADILPMAAQGTFDYQTLGVAPNRKFVVSFCDVPMFSCTALHTSFQILLYETTNEIEVHIANAPNCPGWNAGAAIEGIQNNAGTVAFWVPGRNFPTQWTAAQSSHRFTPTSPSNYTVTAIPFAPIPAINSASVINWYQNGVNPIGTGPSVVVSPSVNTFYVAQAVKCQDTARDTVFITIGGGPTITNSIFTNPTTCGGTDGTITLYGADPNKLYTIQYKKNGVAQTAIVTFSDINGELHLLNLGAGNYSDIIVFEGLCFSNTTGPIILTDPPVVPIFTFNIDFGCDGDTVTFTNTSIQNTFNNWDFGDGTGDTVVNPVHIYPIQGTYTVKLVISNGACKDSSSQIVNTLHPLAASFTEDDDSVCTNQLINFTNTSIVTNPTYLWDFGDSTATSTNPNPAHIYTTPGSYLVTMIVGDLVPCFDTAYKTIVVDTIPYVSFIVSDSALCEGHGVRFAVDSMLQTGITSILWEFGDGTTFPDLQNVLHAYDTAGFFTIKITTNYRNCPAATFTRNVDISPFPAIDLGEDKFICPNGDPIVVADYKNSGNPAAHWIWNNGATTSSILVRHPGVYTARVDINGCINSDSVEVFKDCYLDIPNSFTPNGDGVNDYFLPRQLLSQGVTAFKMSIYNRWGQIVFETNKIDGRGWDGKYNDKEQPMGVFIYLIDATLKSGNHERYQGNVTLIR